MAIVAGSNCILDERITRVFQEMKLVCPKSAPNPACEVFCESADGYVRQEAVVVMVLSCSTQVQAKGGGCYAEVVGHKTTSGSGESVTTPSRDAQLALYRGISDMAKSLLPDDAQVQYVECHGSGTKVGDAMETAVLTEMAKSLQPSVFSHASTGHPLYIGSVKSNIGHTEASCGLMGLLKVLLALEHGTLPPNLHYSQEHSSSSCTGLDNKTLRVVTDLKPIAHDAVVGVNSFGFGGTYVHVLVKGVPSLSTKSASSGAASGCPNEPWKNINPLMGRTHACARTTSNHEKVKLSCFSSTIAPPNCLGGPDMFGVRAFTSPIAKEIFVQDESLSARPRLWLVFTGNGGVWSNMGRELFEQSHLFKHNFLQCDSHLQGNNCDALSRLQTWWLNHPSHSQESSSKPSSLLDGKRPIQDVVDAAVDLVAVQLCLIDLLKTVGLTRDQCDGFVGHSLGEVAAGYFDEAYDRNTALQIALLRGRMSAAVARRQPGAMCVVQGISREQVEELINKMKEETETSVEVACHTGPVQVTLSGTVSDLEVVKLLLLDRQDGTRVRHLETYGAAFHSQLILEDDLKKLRTDLTQVFKTADHFCSQRSEKWKSTCFEASDPNGATVDAEYHCQGIRGCVEFARVIEFIPKEAIVVECGARALLRSVLSPGLSKPSLSLLEYERNAVETLAIVYGQLFLQVVPLLGGTAARLSPREVFSEPSQRATREAFLTWHHQDEFSRFITPCQPHPPLADDLGVGGVRFDLDLAGKDSWLRSHRISGRCLLPAAAYLYIISRGLSLDSEQPCILEDFQVHYPISTDDVETICLALEVHRLVQYTDLRQAVVLCNKKNGCVMYHSGSRQRPEARA